MIIVQNESVVDTSDLQTELERTKEHFENCIIKKETEYAKLWNDWYKKCDECKYDKISYDKAYKDMQQKIERLQAQLGDLKVTSNSVSTPQEPKSVNNDKVIAPGMFRINPSKNSREEKQVPNTVSASARIKPITVSQPPVITKKNVNSDDVGKLKEKGDIGVFVGYSKESAAFRIYNKRTHKIHESVNVNFDEISEMASKQFSLEPEEVFHESSESFQDESSSSSLNNDVQQSSEEVGVPSSNTQSVSNNMVPFVDEGSSSHNVFNECLEDAYFDAST
nr:retrovirus-related Pol polyprotein from transposon TNT 1-94 [Tanacetum cinerariifolium]